MFLKAPIDLTDAAKAFSSAMVPIAKKMSTEDITAFIQGVGKIRFDQQLRLDIDWQDMLDAERLNHFLDLAHISHRKNTEKLLLNLGAGDYKDSRFYLNQTGVLLMVINGD